MLALVALRLGLGCHFLYEGVWKIEHRKPLSAWVARPSARPGGWDVEHREEFSAEPFLTQAKGPLAGFFYAMVPDIDGRATLAGREGRRRQADGGRWQRDYRPLGPHRPEFVGYYRPGKSADTDAMAAYKPLQREGEGKYDEFCKNSTST